MAVYQLEKDNIWFPYPEEAEEDGLLAVGGDLSVERLLLAYSHGIFPWYNPGEEILWWSPRERFVIIPHEIHCSRSLRKFMKKHKIGCWVNRDFADTMHRCRTKREFKEGTWISTEMEEAYHELHKLDYAVSVEAYIDDQLAGGLYGVVIGKCFFGESMFSDMENGSKIALIYLAELLMDHDFYMIDCQFHTDHLESMGGRYISWEEYKTYLER